MEEKDVIKFRDEVYRWKNKLRQEVQALAHFRTGDDPILVVDRLENEGVLVLAQDTGNGIDYYCYGCGYKVLAPDGAAHTCDNKKLLRKVRILEKVKRLLVSLNNTIQMFKLEE